MPETAVRDRLLGLLADILDYPGEDMPGRLRLAEECASESFPHAASLLSEFRATVETTPAERLKEVYTAIFDLNATCHPYIGYQLFGETYKRSVFLVELKEHYRAHGFQGDETELPDRLSLMLRFVSQCDDAELVQDIIDYGFVPSIAKMTKKKEPAVNEPEQREDNPYANVLRALQTVLGPGPAPDGAELARNHAGGEADVR